MESIPSEDDFKRMEAADEALHGEVYQLLWKAIEQFAGEHPTDAEYTVVLDVLDEINEEIQQAIREAKAKQA